MRIRPSTDPSAVHEIGPVVRQPRHRGALARTPAASESARGTRRQPPGWDIDAALDDQVPFPDEHDFWLETTDDERD